MVLDTSTVWSQHALFLPPVFAMASHRYMYAPSDTAMAGAQTDTHFRQIQNKKANPSFTTQMVGDSQKMAVASKRCSRPFWCPPLPTPHFRREWRTAHCFPPNSWETTANKGLGMGQKVVLAKQRALRVFGFPKTTLFKDWEYSKTKIKDRIIPNRTTKKKSKCGGG